MQQIQNKVAKKLARLNLLLSVFIITMAACNNKKADSEKEKHTFIKQFSAYKINKTDIPPTGSQYDKFIMNVSLDDLANPSKMGLIYYPVNSQSQPMVIGNPSPAMDTTIANLTLYSKNILIGNNELKLADYQSLTFDFLLLIPTRDGDNLSFSVSAYTNSNGSLQPVTLPVNARQSKPSPPAPPNYPLNF